MEEYDWDPAFQMGDESSAIAQRVWPRFLCEDSDIPQPGLQFEIDEAEFLRRYPAWGLREKSTARLVAYINAVLIAGGEGPLPEEGWQFAMQAGARETEPDCLCLVVANVDPSVQNRRLSGLLLDKAKAEAKHAGLRTIIAPVRPSHRHLRPDLSFEEYVRLLRSDGLPEDPWLRAHVRAGAEFVSICSRSSVVTATPAKWSGWTGKDYPASGTYPLERGLAPLVIDLESDVGTYVEPNAWFRYRL